MEDLRNEKQKDHCKELQNYLAEIGNRISDSQTVKELTNATLSLVAMIRLIPVSSLRDEWIRNIKSKVDTIISKAPENIGMVVLKEVTNFKNCIEVALGTREDDTEYTDFVYE